MKIVGARAMPTTIIGLNNATVELPPDVGFVTRTTVPGQVRTLASSFQVDVDDGMLFVGTDQYQLAPNYQVAMAGFAISLAETEGRNGPVIVAKGELPYVLLNGVPLTKGVFWYLPPPLAVFILGGLVTGAARLVRRWWAPLRDRLFF